MQSISQLTPARLLWSKASDLRGCISRMPLVLAGSLMLALGPQCAAPAAVQNAPAATPPDQPVVLELTGMR